MNFGAKISVGLFVIFLYTSGRFSVQKWMLFLMKNKSLFLEKKSFLAVLASISKFLILFRWCLATKSKYRYIHLLYFFWQTTSTMYLYLEQLHSSCPHSKAAWLLVYLLIPDIDSNLTIHIGVMTHVSIKDFTNPFLSIYLLMFTWIQYVALYLNIKINFQFWKLNLLLSSSLMQW